MKKQNKKASKKSCSCMIPVIITAIIFTIAMVALSILRPPETPIPRLSEDRKQILADDEVLLSIDDDVIFNFFKEAGNPCNQPSPENQYICGNEAVFRDASNFESISPSIDRKTIGFTIESDALHPDTGVGILYSNRKSDKVKMLTNYYLGNRFISFSPSGENFAYMNRCWEGLCGLTIKNSDTLEIKAQISNPEDADARQHNGILIRWISDNNIEYILQSDAASSTIQKMSF